MKWIDRLWGRSRKPSLVRGVQASPRWIAAPERVTPLKRPAADANFPRFQSSASDQFDHRDEDSFSAYRMRLRTAFTPAQPIIDRRMFAGRTRVLVSLIRAIEDQRLHGVIHGERGLGKTSLLHVLAQAAREARYLVVYETCGAGSTFDESFRAIAAGISLMFHSQYGPTAPETERGDTFASLLGPEPVTVRAAEDLLAKIAGTRVLVVLDEFDRAESHEFRRHIAELLKSLSDRALRVQLVIAGVAANLNELVTNVPSVQRNIFALHVPKMSPMEIRELIKNGEAVSGIGFDDGAIHAIVTRAMGLPYLASLISHRAALAAIKQGRTAVGVADVALATDEVVDEFRGRISRRSQMQIDELVRKGCLIPLGVLAGAAQNSGGPFTREEIVATHASPAAVEAAKALAESLAAKTLLIEAREEEFGRGYAFIEDTAPPYLWLLSVDARAAEAAEPLTRRAAG